MDLLEKFAAVEIKAEGRISAADREFCEQHQAAYEAATNGYKELMFFWEDMKARQTEHLADDTSPYYQDYLLPARGCELNISQEALQMQVADLHTRYAKIIVRYFSDTYHLSDGYDDICGLLVPSEPSRWCDDREEQMEQYHNQMLELVVRYQDIVEQFALRMDGRSFGEQALYEMQAACHAAAWNLTKEEPLFERKKETVRFNGSYSWYNYRDCWTINENMKTILRGAAHYETGTFDTFPLGFGDLLRRDELYDDVIEFSTCEKLCQIKIFKRGRVDLKFSGEIFAEEFICNYLGTFI